MASVTVSREDLFPDGTTVNAYEATGRGHTPTSGAPAGSSAGSAAVSGGVVTITGLESGKSYILYASSPDRYLRVNTSVAAGAESAKGFVFWTTGGVPNRPGFGSVEWIGTDDPDTAAEDGDTWTPTAA